MTRRRYVQIDGELVEVSPDHQREPQRHDGVLWNDRSYQDAGDPRFASRSQHREYMRSKGLTTIDDYTQHNQREAKRRAEFYTNAPDPSRRSDIERALTQRKST